MINLKASRKYKHKPANRMTEAAHTKDVPKSKRKKTG